MKKGAEEEESCHDCFRTLFTSFPYLYSHIRSYLPPHDQVSFIGTSPFLWCYQIDAHEKLYEAMNFVVVPKHLEEDAKLFRHYLHSSGPFPQINIETGCHSSLFVRYFGKEKGYGLCTKSLIKEGEVLGWYAGEMITSNLKEQRYQTMYDKRVSV